METEQEAPVSDLQEERTDLCLCVSYLRATERAALAGARWLGRADQEGAEEAAVSGMRRTLEELPMTGRVLVGVGESGEVPSMPETLGSGGIDVDLALDPLEGRGVVARGGNGAISMIVAAEPGKLRRLPDMYMRTIAAGPLARGRISLLAPVGDNVRAIAEAFLAQHLGGKYQPIGDDFKGSSIQVPNGADQVPGLTARLTEVSGSEPFKNTDEDMWNKVPAGSDDEHAREIVDPWGTPYIYISKNFYGTPVKIVKDDGTEIEVSAVKRPSGAYYNAETYQILSLGKDGEQNMETSKSDDIENFTRDDK